MNRIKVKGHPNLVRNPRTGVIINTDRQGFEGFVRHRSRLEAQTHKISELTQEISELKKLIGQIIKKEMP